MYLSSVCHALSLNNTFLWDRHLATNVQLGRLLGDYKPYMCHVNWTLLNQGLDIYRFLQHHAIAKSGWHMTIIFSPILQLMYMYFRGVARVLGKGGQVLCARNIWPRPLVKRKGKSSRLTWERILNFMVRSLHSRLLSLLLIIPSEARFYSGSAEIVWLQSIFIAWF